MNQFSGKQKSKDAQSLLSKEKIRMRDKIKAPGNILIAFVVFNALAYIALGFVFGGWGLGGKVIGRSYYVGYRNIYTPVSQAVYTYSLWHGYSQPLFLFLLIFFGPRRENRILL